MIYGDVLPIKLASVLVLAATMIFCFGAAKGRPPWGCEPILSRGETVRSSTDLATLDLLPFANDIVTVALSSKANEPHQITFLKNGLRHVLSVSTAGAEYKAYSANGQWVTNAANRQIFDHALRASAERSPQIRRLLTDHGLLAP